MKILTCLAVLSSLAVGAHAKLVEKTVTYDHGGTTLEGFHVYDDAVSGKRPGILVIHQWTGLSDHEKSRSRMLAELGYNVFAADVYGQGIRPKPPQAADEAGKYYADRALFRARLQAALDQLTADERTDKDRMAAIGYCFGGTGVLEMARADMPVAGVVSFHGGYEAAEGMQAETGKIRPEILVLHGADDPYTPPEQVDALEKELKAAGANFQINIYSGAVHSFTQKEAGDDNSKGAAYNERADKRSWLAMKAFFAEIFSK